MKWRDYFRWRLDTFVQTAKLRHMNNSLFDQRFFGYKWRRKGEQYHLFFLRFVKSSVVTLAYWMMIAGSVAYQFFQWRWWQLLVIMRTLPVDLKYHLYLKHKWRRMHRKKLYESQLS